MLKIDHKFALVLFGGEGEPLGSAAVEADWEPAVQWTSFYFVRRGELPLNNGCGTVSILPLWDRELKAPYCRGFRVSIARAGQSPCTSDFPPSYFRRVAAKGGSALRGAREDGERCRLSLRGGCTREERFSRALVTRAGCRWKSELRHSACWTLLCAIGKGGRLRSA